MSYFKIGESALFIGPGYLHGELVTVSSESHYIVMFKLDGSYYGTYLGYQIVPPSGQVIHESGRPFSARKEWLRKISPDEDQQPTTTWDKCIFKPSHELVD